MTAAGQHARSNGKTRPSFDNLPSAKASKFFAQPFFVVRYLESSPTALLKTKTCAFTHYTSTTKAEQRIFKILPAETVGRVKGRQNESSAFLLACTRLLTTDPQMKSSSRGTPDFCTPRAKPFWLPARTSEFDAPEEAW